MKKKSIALLLVLALVVSLFASCGKKNDAPADSKSPANSDQQTPENQGSNSSSDNNSEETDTNPGTANGRKTRKHSRQTRLWSRN